MSKPFFYRIDAAEFLAEVFKIPEGQHKQWVSSLALDLVSGNGTTEYSAKLISEVDNYRKKQAEHGKKGGKPTHKQPYTDPIPTLTDPIPTPYRPLPNSINNNTTVLKEESKEKTFCAEQAHAPAEFSFILSDKSMFDLPDEKIDEWIDLYLGIDVRQELKKLVDWCVDNPRKRKTRDGAMRFVRSWLNRAESNSKKDADSFDMDAYLRQCGVRYGN